MQLNRTCTISDPLALKLLQQPKYVGIVLATLVRCSNLLLRGDSYQFFGENNTSYVKKPATYQRLIVAKYLRRTGNWYFRLQRAKKDAWMAATPFNLQRIFGDVHRLLIYEPCDTGRRNKSKFQVDPKTFSEEQVKQPVGGTVTRTRRRFFAAALGGVASYVLAEAGEAHQKY